MNPKQAAPLLAALPALAVIAPPIIIGGLIGCGILLLLKALSDEEKQPEAASVEASTEARKPAETAAFRQIPAEIPAKSAPVPAASIPRPAVRPSIVPPMRPASVPAPAPAIPRPAIVPQVQIAPPIPKRTVSRKDMADIFQQGGRMLTRTKAVAALKQLGFGKTAAYSALSMDGRFAAWMEFAPDGIIIWTDGQK
jgi:hypothetical protein